MIQGKSIMFHTKIHEPKRKDLLKKKYQTIPPIKLSEFNHAINFLKFAFHAEDTIHCSIGCFDTEKIFGQETPIILTDFSPYELRENSSLVRRLIKTMDFNMMHFGIAMNLEVIVSQDTSIYIFSRVARGSLSFTESFTPVISCKLTGHNIIFSYGIFLPCENESINLYQAIQTEIYPFKGDESDMKVQIKVLDTCNEKIITNIFVNNVNYSFVSKIFYPFSGYGSMAFGAVGKECILKRVNIEEKEINIKQVK